MRASWEAARTRVVGAQDLDQTIPTIVAARVVAHHILSGVGKPISVLRLGKSVLSKNWRQYEFDGHVVDVLGESLEVLRSPWSQTRERIDAIAMATSVMGSAWHWHQVENAVLHQLFGWPLLVFSKGEDAVSLPVGIDIAFDRKGVTKVDPPHGGSIHVGAWLPSLRDAGDAAKVLWRGKHGNAGAFRDAVVSANVVFDFGVAEEIVAGFAEPITLVDNSMEAYFSQLVLSRILGNAVSSASVVTGSIGKRRTDEPGGFADYEFLWPGSVRSKLKYVFRSRFFERVILPDINEDDERRTAVSDDLKQSRSSQTTEV